MLCFKTCMLEIAICCVINNVPGLASVCSPGLFLEQHDGRKNRPPVDGSDYYKVCG